MAAPKTRAAAPAGFDRIHRILGTAMRAADPATWPARPHRNGALPVLSSRSQLEIALALCGITRALAPPVEGFERAVAWVDLVLGQAQIGGPETLRVDLDRESTHGRADPPALRIAKLAVRAAKNFLFSPPSARTAVGANVEKAPRPPSSRSSTTYRHAETLDQLVVQRELAALLAARDLAPVIDLVISRPPGATLARLADGTFGVLVKQRSRWSWQRRRSQHGVRVCPRRSARAGRRRSRRPRTAVVRYAPRWCWRRCYRSRVIH